MLDTVHVLVGLTIGKAVPNPYLAFGLGIASHFALDFIPHWDGIKSITGKEGQDLTGTDWLKQKKRFTKTGKLILGLDILVSFAIFLYLSIGGPLWPDFPVLKSFVLNLYSHPAWVAGVLGALLPDVFLLLHIFTGWYKPRWLFILEFHKKLQPKNKKPSPLPSLVLQIIAVIGLISYFVR